MRALLLAIALVSVPTLAAAEASRVVEARYVAGVINTCALGGAPGETCLDVLPGETSVLLRVADDRAPEVAFNYAFSGGSSGASNVACSVDPLALTIPPGATSLRVHVYPAGHAACGSMIEALPATTGLVAATFT